MGLAEQQCGQRAARSSSGKNATPACLPPRCCQRPHSPDSFSACSCVGHCSPLKDNPAELKEGDLVKM